jgi:4-amino-4-deoxy-L-arabinose transferase-like glycosyltransferase
VSRSWPDRKLRARLRRKITTDSVLFGGALLLFLVTRLYGLDRFPIYFFTDEAIQDVSAADLLHRDFRNSLGEQFPVYFPNGPYLNPMITVYARIIPHAVFGYSEFVTRAISVLLALSGTAAVGLIARDVFRLRFWWLATLLLAITPAWFLHSRTAFDPVQATSFYAWFLFFYLRVRTSGTWNLYPALLFAALAFYSYSATQIVIATTLAAFVLSDIRFYSRHLRASGLGIALLAVLTVPYLRFSYAHSSDISSHLRALGSYWVTDISLEDKLRHFFHEYLYGLSPRFGYAANNHRDLVRHQMKGCGNILVVTFPFALVGVVVCALKIRSPAHRALLIATLVCPMGAALAATAVTRDLVFVVPAAVLTALGGVTMITPLVTRIRYVYVATALFVLLAGVNLAMLADALANGPTWYRDYGLSGMQYGGRQVTAAARDYLKRHPGGQVIISPTWANGTDVVVRFFLPNEPRVQLGNIDAYTLERRELRDSWLFVMTPDEFHRLVRDRRFTDIRPVQTLPWPDGRTGFFFVRFRYSKRADAIFAAERRRRAQLVHETVALAGRRVDVAHSRLDLGRIVDVFDGDKATLARSKESNPFVVTLTFSRGVLLHQIAVTTGSMRPQISATILPVGGSRARTRRVRLEHPGIDPTLLLDLGTALRARRIEIRIHDPDSPERAHVHVREIQLR